MSSVTLTRMVPGQTASSTEHNANVTAWTNALGTGDITEENIREQGLDRCNIDDDSIEVTSREGASRWFESDTPSGVIAAPGAVTMGGNPVQITGLSVATGDDMTIRFAGWLTGAAGSQYRMVLERNSGAGWSAITATRRPFNYAGGAVVLQDNYVVTHRHAGGAGTWSYRLAVSAVGAGNVNVKNAVLFAEIVSN